MAGTREAGGNSGVSEIARERGNREEPEAGEGEIGKSKHEEERVSTVIIAPL